MTMTPDPQMESVADALALEPSGHAVSPAEHRELMSRFPTGVSVVTVAEEGGPPQGLTCTSLASVSLEPPVISVSLRSGSSTLARIRDHGYFAVNLLHTRGRPVAEVFARPVTDRFACVRWERSALTGQPWLVDDAVAHASCEVLSATVVGDHELVLGVLREVRCVADLPLLYGLRQFSAWSPVSGPSHAVPARASR